MDTAGDCQLPTGEMLFQRQFMVIDFGEQDSIVPCNLGDLQNESGVGLESNLPADDMTG